MKTKYFIWLFDNIYHASLNNLLEANGDFREQIFARDSNNSRETEEVINLLSRQINNCGQGFLSFITAT